MGGEGAVAQAGTRPVGAPSWRGLRIDRPRLTERLLSRFERPLTVVRGGAGFGKTTALVFAIDNNLIDPVGEDLWFSAEPADIDPIVWTSRLCRDLDLPAPSTVDAAIEVLADALWGRSPSEISLFIDDAHLMVSTSDGAAAVERLIEHLPANAHVVLGLRNTGELAVARLQAAQLVEMIGEADLAFTPEELRDFADRSGADSPHALPSWPALAALQLQSGVDRGFEFIWQEILRRLPADRMRQLTAVAGLESFDDEILARVTGIADASARDLVDGLSGVDFHAGRVHLHALVRDTIATTSTSADIAHAHRCAAEVELERGHRRAAIEHRRAAGDVDETLRIALEYARLPILVTPMDDLVVIHRALRALAPEHPITDHFDASLYWETEELQTIVRFERVARRAREDDLPELEEIALWRVIQSRHLGGELSGPDTMERLETLAASHPFSAGVLAQVRSHFAQAAGDPDGVLAAVRDAPSMGFENDVILRAQRYGDIGRPELVRQDDGEDLASLFHAQAIWQRGEVAPVDALALALPSVERTRKRGIIHERISLLGVMTLVALAAGDHDRAVAWAREARELTDRSIGGSITTFGSLADAALALSTDGEEAAAKHLHAAFERNPPAPWPERAHFYALPLMHLCVPEVRADLESLDLGPPLTAVVEAAAALVASRDGDPSGLDSVRWDRPHLLRAHFLPPHLAELALAGHVRGIAAATTLLDDIPTSVGLWSVLRSHPDPSVLDHARAVLRADGDGRAAIGVRVLGPLSIDGPASVDVEFQRRERVRALLGYLVEHRRTSRSSARAALWPELDDDKAENNLRVNLSHLRNVMEPDREARQESRFIRTDGEHIELTGQLRIDADEFESKVMNAQQTDLAGSPAAALDLYLDALAHYRGDYLADYENQTWGTLERFRLRSLATAAMCRVGELELARGEPERASGWAVRAQRLDPLLERAGRLLVSSFLGVDDRSGARSAAARLNDELRAAGLDPGAETIRTFRSVGVGA